MENSPPDETASEAPYPPPSGPDDDRVAALEAEVSALEEQLDRRERQLDDVVTHYESLLEERTRAASEAEGFVWSGADESDPDTGTDAATGADGPGLLTTMRSLF